MMHRSIKRRCCQVVYALKYRLTRGPLGKGLKKRGKEHIVEKQKRKKKRKDQRKKKEDKGNRKKRERKNQNKKEKGV